MKNRLNLNLHFENGHYYSPIPNIKEIKEKEVSIFAKDKQLLGINLNEENQFELFHKIYPDLAEFYQLIQKDRLRRYYIYNDFFEFFDAGTLYSIMNQLKPKKLFK